MKTMVKVCCVCLVVGASSFAALPVLADTVYWTNWTTQNVGMPGSAMGTIALPSGNVNVDYLGEVAGWLDQGDWDYPGTYTKPGVVDNTPTPQYVSVTLNGNNNLTNTIYFSSPVVNPVMAIQSLGQYSYSATYVFNIPFTILNYGPGRWGGGGPGTLTQNGNNLTGFEGNGIIQFTGQYSSISWSVPEGEYYHMFTVGAPAAVPEPATMLLLGTGITGLVAARRKKKA